SRRRWFGTCSCKPVPRGLPSSVKQLRTPTACWLRWCSWHTIVGISYLWISGSWRDRSVASDYGGRPTLSGILLIPYIIGDDARNESARQLRRRPHENRGHPSDRRPADDAPRRRHQVQFPAFRYGVLLLLSGGGTGQATGSAGEHVGRDGDSVLLPC